MTLEDTKEKVENAISAYTTYSVRILKIVERSVESEKELRGLHQSVANFLTENGLENSSQDFVSTHNRAFLSHSQLRDEFLEVINLMWEVNGALMTAQMDYWQELIDMFPEELTDEP